MMPGKGEWKEGSMEYRGEDTPDAKRERRDKERNVWGRTVQKRHLMIREREDREKGRYERE